MGSLQGVLSSRRSRIGAGFAFFLLVLMILAASLSPHGLAIPRLHLEYALQSNFNESKVGLLIENRPQPILAPLLLKFMYTMPPDWRFQFMGSEESVAYVNKSAAIRKHVASGKMDLTLIPSNMSTAGQEMISRFLTTLWLYETVLQPAEHLLVFQSDSMICSNCKHHMDQYLDYDWVGAPWNPGGRWGGNGGLSLRRVSRIIDVLRNQQRIDDSEPEDVWLSERLGHHATGKVAAGDVSSTFSGEMNGGPEEKVEESWDKIEESWDADQSMDESHRDYLVKGIDDWRDGFYEPMGYHIGGSGRLWGQVWGTKEKREHVYNYCPEAKMILDMDMVDFIKGECLEDFEGGSSVQ